AMSHALLAVTQGNVEEAEEHLRRARELAPSIRDPQALGPQVAVQMHLALARGQRDVSQALDLLAPLIQDASTYGGLALVARVCAVAALEGDPAGISGLERIQGLFETRAAG